MFEFHYKRHWAPWAQTVLWKIVISHRPTNLANFCQDLYDTAMTTMNISLPDALKSFVDEQVSTRGFGTSSEYVRELIRKDQDRLQLRGLLLAGAASKSSVPADGVYFAGLRDRINQRTAG